ncbi:hypothetical protein MRX96_007557 [Rhipicephalus microplus]
MGAAMEPCVSQQLRMKMRVGGANVGEKAITWCKGCGLTAGCGSPAGNVCTAQQQLGAHPRHAWGAISKRERAHPFFAGATQSGPRWTIALGGGRAQFAESVDDADRTGDRARRSRGPPAACLAWVIDHRAGWACRYAMPDFSIPPPRPPTSTKRQREDPLPRVWTSRKVCGP